MPSKHIPQPPGPPNATVQGRTREWRPRPRGSSSPVRFSIPRTGSMLGHGDPEHTCRAAEPLRRRDASRTPRSLSDEAREGGHRGTGPGTGHLERFRGRAALPIGRPRCSRPAGSRSFQTTPAVPQREPHAPFPLLVALGTPDPVHDITLHRALHSIVGSTRSAKQRPGTTSSAPRCQAKACARDRSLAGDSRRLKINSRQRPRASFDERANANQKTRAGRRPGHRRDGSEQ